MPNYCYNTLEIHAADEVIARIHRYIRSSESDFDFENVLLIPAEEKDNWYKWCCKNWGTKWNAMEGAAELYENDASPLRQLAIENDMLTAAVAFDTIGSALYNLREDIRSLQEAHSRDCLTTKGSLP